jgi:trans-2,3-dihydro-3-hydroxyanthranilate isomerase
MNYAFHTVDVFTQIAFKAAPIAVFPRADCLNEQQMQLMAREINHAETVFLFSGISGTKADLRVFSPSGADPVGSHNIVAAAQTLLHSKALSIGDANCVVHFSQDKKIFDVLL